MTVVVVQEWARRDGRAPQEAAHTVRQWSKGSGVVVTTAVPDIHFHHHSDSDSSHAEGAASHGSHVDSGAASTGSHAVSIDGGSFTDSTHTARVHTAHTAHSTPSTPTTSAGENDSTDGTPEPPRPKWTKKMLRAMAAPARPEKVAMALFGLQGLSSRHNSVKTLMELLVPFCRSMPERPYGRLVRESCVCGGWIDYVGYRLSSSQGDFFSFPSHRLLPCPLSRCSLSPSFVPP